MVNYYNLLRFNYSLAEARINNLFNVTTIIIFLTGVYSKHFRKHIEPNRTERMRLTVSTFDLIQFRNNTRNNMNYCRAQKVSGKIESALLWAVGSLGSGHSKAARFPQAAQCGTACARSIERTLWRPFITVFLNWFSILVGRRGDEWNRGMVAFAIGVATRESTGW